MVFDNLSSYPAQRGGCNADKRGKVFLGDFFQIRWGLQEI